MAVHLLIKSPNQQVDDVKIECDRTWSIDMVKEHISSVYPTKPRKEEQKLIYCGRLLQNHLLLKDILNQSQETHTMHLVCPFSMNSEKANNEASHVDHAHSGESESSNFSFTDFGSNTLRHRLTGAPQTLVPPVSEFYTPQVNTMSADPTFSPEQLVHQMAAMQQMYAQFMAQCLSQGYPQMYPVPPYGANSQVNTTQPSGAPQVMNNFNNVRPQEQRQPNNGNNEAPGPDLLDCVYIMTRLAMLVAILYFYSSLDRILLVLSLGLLFFIYQAGVFERRIQQVNNRVEENHTHNDVQDEQNSPQDNTVHVTEQNSDDIHADTDNENGTLESASPASSENLLSKLTVAFKFVTTLFTSLVPELPAPVNIN